MGHINCSGTHAVVKGPQFLGHMFAKLRVQRAQGFIHHEGLGVAHDGTSQRHPLTIATREPADRPIEDISIPRIFATSATFARTAARGIP